MAWHPKKVIIIIIIIVIIIIIIIIIVIEKYKELNNILRNKFKKVELMNLSISALRCIC